jgi:hypothetical protein
MGDGLLMARIGDTVAVLETVGNVTRDELLTIVDPPEQRGADKLIWVVRADHQHEAPIGFRPQSLRAVR